MELHLNNAPTCMFVDVCITQSINNQSVGILPYMFIIQCNTQVRNLKLVRRVAAAMASHCVAVVTQTSYYFEINGAINGSFDGRLYWQ